MIFHQPGRSRKIGINSPLWEFRVTYIYSISPWSRASCGIGPEVGPTSGSIFVRSWAHAARWNWVTKRMDQKKMAPKSNWHALTILLEFTGIYNLYTVHSHKVREYSETQLRSGIRISLFGTLPWLAFKLLFQSRTSTWSHWSCSRAQGQGLGVNESLSLMDMYHSNLLLRWLLNA